MLANMIASISIIIYPIYVYLRKNRIKASSRELTKDQIIKYSFVTVIVGFLLSLFSFKYMGLSFSLLPLFFSISTKYFGWKVTMPSMLISGIFFGITFPVLQIWPVALIYLFYIQTLYPLQLYLEKKWDEYSQLFVLVAYNNLMLSILCYFIIQDLTLLLIFYFISSLFNYIMLTALYFIVKDFKHLHEMIDYDYLTRLLNVRRFKERLARLESFRNLPLTITVLDIDWFKSYNDEYGHDAGDKILWGVSQVFAAYSADEVTAYRIGGEEFGIITKNLNLEEAELIIADIMDNVVNRPIPLGRDKSVSVTLSVGLIFVHDNETMEQAWQRADQAMYTAKRNGRNQLFVDRRTCGSEEEFNHTFSEIHQIK